jgi:hypothetical protein
MPRKKIYNLRQGSVFIPFIGIQPADHIAFGQVKTFVDGFCLPSIRLNKNLYVNSSAIGLIVSE